MLRPKHVLGAGRMGTGRGIFDKETRRKPLARTTNYGDGMLFSFEFGVARMWMRAVNVKAGAIWGLRRDLGWGVRDSVKARKAKLLEGEDAKARACVGHVEGPIWRVVL
jgi:hypothetical protein